MSDTKTYGITAGELDSFIQRIERLEEEKSNLSSDIRDVFTQAKGHGFDVKVMKQIIRLRRLEPHEREEAEMLLRTYMAALGMVVESDEDDSSSD